MGSISGQCIVVVHARSLDNGVHTHPIDGGMLTCILQDTSLKWDETPPADTRFIPFASSFLLTKCQVPTRAQNAVMLGGGTDSCQSVPPHRAPAEPPPLSSCCCQADSPPGSLLANPVWQGANWDLCDSTQCLESHFALPPGEEEEEGARRRRLHVLPSPSPPAVLQANYQHYRERRGRGRKWGF